MSEDNLLLAALTRIEGKVDEQGITLAGMKASFEAHKEVTERNITRLWEHENETAKILPVLENNFKSHTRNHPSFMKLMSSVALISGTIVGLIELLKYLKVPWAL